MKRVPARILCGSNSKNEPVLSSMVTEALAGSGLSIQSEAPAEINFRKNS
jgi:hypothetical protein